MTRGGWDVELVDVNLGVLVVAVGAIYLAAGVVAGPKAAARLDASLGRRFPAARRWTRPLATTSVGRLVAVLLWLLLVGVVRVGFLLGWWDVFGREDGRHRRRE